MSDAAKTTELAPKEAKHAEPSNAFTEAMDFCSETVKHPEARIRQTGTVLHGIVVGGIKDIPNELMNHPLETCGKVAVAGGLGVAAGALIGLEIPIVTGITIGAGATMLGYSIFDSFKRMSSNKELQGSLNTVYRNADFANQAKANAQAEKVLGPEAFNWGVTLPACIVGGFGGNLATKLVSAKILNGKVGAVQADTPELVSDSIANTKRQIFKDGEETNKVDDELYPYDDDPFNSDYQVDTRRINDINDAEDAFLTEWDQLDPIKLEWNPTIELERFGIPGKTVTYHEDKYSALYYAGGRRSDRLQIGELVKISEEGVRYVATGHVRQMPRVLRLEDYAKLEERANRPGNCRDKFAVTPTSYYEFMKGKGFNPQETLDEPTSSY